MSKTIETFVIGTGNVPDWVSSYMANGIIQKVEDDYEGVYYFRINTPTGVKKANVGDVLVRTRSGVSLVPADKAEKFKMVQKKVVKEKVDEAKENES